MDRNRVPACAGITCRLGPESASGDNTTGTDADVTQIVLGVDASAQLDLFTRIQLNAVLNICLESTSMADAGRKLFAVSRMAKERANDSDRLRKYLQRFGLTWQTIKDATAGI